MNRLLMVAFLSTAFLFSGFIEEAGEVPRSQDLKKLMDKVKDTTIVVDPDNYVFALEKLSEKEKLKAPHHPLHDKIITKLNREFSLPEVPFHFKHYISQVLLKGADEGRLNAVKKMALEEGEWEILLDLVRKNLEGECEIVHKKNEKQRKIEEVKMKKYRRNKTYWKPEKCFYDSMTVADKKAYFDKLFKEIMKYYILRDMYLTKDMSKEQIRKLIQFYRGSDWQNFHKARKEYTERLILGENFDMFRKKGKVETVKPVTKPKSKSTVEKMRERIKKGPTLPKKEEKTPEELLQMKLF